MDGQAQNLVGEPLGMWQRAGGEVAEGRVLVQGQAIEEAGADPLLVERGADRITIRHADRIEREGAFHVLGSRRNDDSPLQGLVVVRRDLTAALKLGLEDLELGKEDRR